MELDNFTVKLLSDDSGASEIKSNISRVRRESHKTPFGHTLRSFSFFEEGGWWFIPDQKIVDVLAFQLSFEMHANLRARDVDDAKFSYVFARQFSDSTQSRIWRNFVSRRDVGKASTKPRTFVHVNPLRDGSILADITLGIGAVAGFAAAYPNVRRGVFEIISDAKKIRNFCEKAIERARGSDE